MLKKAVFVAVLSMSISFAGTGAFARMGGGASFGGHGFAAGHYAMPHTMNSLGSDNVLARNRDQFRQQEHLRTTGSATAGQQYRGQTTQNGNTQNSVAIDRNSNPPTNSTP